MTRRVMSTTWRRNYWFCEYWISNASECCLQGGQ